MTTAPRLLNNNTMQPIPKQFFWDIQMDKIISEAAIEIMRQPCESIEIIHRQELFAILEKKEYFHKINACLALLTDYQHSLQLWQNAATAVERYHLNVRILSEYVQICESLTSLFDCGSLFRNVSNHYGSEEKKKEYAAILLDISRSKQLLQNFRQGSFSFSDKNWVTPSDTLHDEFDDISICAKKIGFSVPSKKKQNIRIDPTMSDALCRLYSAEVTELETIFKKYTPANFYVPLSYIGEIKFFLEIHRLVQKAKQENIAYCYPNIAENCVYFAKDLYDVSLFAKNCKTIVPNDADFSENENFFFLIGANGGGKTTYLRALGINLILFLSGCPIFAKEATIYPFDFIASHFPADERFEDIGRLDEEWKRTQEILSLAAGQKAFFLFNETFSGTDEKKGFELLKRVSKQLNEVGYFGLYVTHFHEVMSLDLPILSAQVNIAQDHKRTYRIVKSKGIASSYAEDILKKYRLDKNSLIERRNAHGN